MDFEKLRESMLKYRARENISQGELASRCNLSKQTIWSIENGQQTPSAITVEKIKLVIG